MLTKVIRLKKKSPIVRLPKEFTNNKPLKLKMICTSEKLTFEKINEEQK